MRKYTDNEIITRIGKADTDEVLKYLYDRVKPKIRRWIIKNNGSEDEAQDIFQDAVIAFYKYVQQNRFEFDKSVEAFVFSIGKNLWVNKAKYNKKFSSKGESYMLNYEDDDHLNLDELDEDREKKVLDILSLLGDRCKEILTYSIFYRLSMEDISERMGFNNTNTAKTKNYKCKQRLIKLVKENESIKEALYS